MEPQYPLNFEGVYEDIYGDFEFFFTSGSRSGFHRNALDRNPDLAKCLDPYRLKFVKGLLSADILFYIFFI